MSSLTAFICLLYGLPHCLFPGRCISNILLPIYPLSLLCMSNHLGPASPTLSTRPSTCAVSLRSSSFIPFILVTPKENFQHIQLYHFPVLPPVSLSVPQSPSHIILLLWRNFRPSCKISYWPLLPLFSHKFIPETFLHPGLSSLPHSMFSWAVDTKYSKSCTFPLLVSSLATFPLTIALRKLRLQK